ncbi:MAG: hypothetical protein HYZ65_09910 [Burkholderiales bacterium]|nr:hypothetical protein [Burkholderiales bacterium]
MSAMQRLWLLLLWAAGTACADDLDALKLADQPAPKAERASDSHWYAETALVSARYGKSRAYNQRLSLEFQLDKTLAPGWRAVLADRLDLNWRQQPARQDGVNTLKEAYLSRQLSTEQIVDLGRINVTQGLASGYNPTDFLRDGALRSVISVDPASLKKNRLGSVMLRGQQLWDGGSLTALYSPKIAAQANGAALSPDFGATNKRERWLLALSRQMTPTLAPQWLLYGSRGQAPQFGFNLSCLLNDATVLYLEWAGGRSRSLLSQALHGADDSAFRNRLASGLTYTTPNKLTLTLEYEYNGSAPDDAGWDALGRGSPLAYATYRAWQQQQQELPTRQEVFFYANWQDAGLNHLDLAAMQKYNLADHSRLSWLEARYHLDKVDLALQWQGHNGTPVSAYGAAAQQRAWQLLLRYYF